MGHLFLKLCVLNQSDLTPESLARLLNDLSKNPDKLIQMGKKARMAKIARMAKWAKWPK